jgi:hypothetical protein
MQAVKMLYFRALKNSAKSGVTIKETSISKGENYRMSRSARKKRQRDLLATMTEVALEVVNQALGGPSLHQEEEETLGVAAEGSNPEEMMQDRLEIMEGEKAIVVEVHAMEAVVKEITAGTESIIN